MKIKILALTALLALSQSAFASVHAIVDVKDQYGYRSQITVVKTHHEIHIRNGDDHKKRYHYFFEIRCGNMLNKKDYDIDLEGREEFTKSEDLSLELVKDAGQYKIEATTTISNAESDREGKGAMLRIL